MQRQCRGNRPQVCRGDWDGKEGRKRSNGFLAIGNGPEKLGLSGRLQIKFIVLQFVLDVQEGPKAILVHDLILLDVMATFNGSVRVHSLERDQHRGGGVERPDLQVKRFADHEVVFHADKGLGQD